jgi:lysophospholipase L1-like esterase
VSVTNSVYIHGDSFTDNSAFAFDQWGVLLNNPPIVDNDASTGQRLETMAASLVTLIPALRTRCSFAIIQGGINDVLNAAATGDDLETFAQSCITTIQNAGLDLIMINIAPFGDWTGWNSTRQSYVEQYNTWLATQASVQGFYVVDIYDGIGDPVAPTTLLAAYDEDTLHPNAAGQAVIAGLVNSAIANNNLITTVDDMANEYKRWRGAVEPDETSASGNEYKAWRGAVEPAGATGYFPGTVASDGGTLWPSREEDPRWAQILTDSGITQSGNFQDDVRTALIAIIASRGSLDDLWKKFKVSNSKTDTSEPFTY